MKEWLESAEKEAKMKKDESDIQEVGENLKLAFDYAKGAILGIGKANSKLAEGIKYILDRRTSPTHPMMPPLLHLGALSFIELGVDAGIYFLTGFDPIFGIPHVGNTLGITNLVLAGHAWWAVYRGREEQGTFGNARFAQVHEIKKAGLIESGIVFGRVKKHLITKSEKTDGHVVVVGSTGSGKSKSFVIPSLMNWKGSSISIDPKGELYEWTSHLKENVFYFNPTSKECDQYNPVMSCNTMEGAKELATILLPAPRGGDPFWSDGARGILAACLMDGYQKKQSLHEVCKRICNTDNEQLRDELLNSDNPNVSILASVVRGTPEKTLGGIFSQLRASAVSDIAADTDFDMKRCDWTPESLEDGANIYLIIPEEKLELRHYQAVLNSIINATMRYLTKRPEGQEPSILMMIDEFPRLGMIPQMKKSIATLRSRNVHISLIIQDFSQLDDIYGHHARRTILANCDYKLILRCTDPDTQRLLSQMAGMKTAKSSSTNHKEEEESKRLSEVGVPLIRPEEFGRPDFRAVLFNPKTHPIQLNRVWFNQDPKFKPLADKKDWAKVYPMPEKKEKEEEKEAVSILDIIDKK